MQTGKAAAGEHETEEISGEGERATGKSGGKGASTYAPTFHCCTLHNECICI